MKGNTRVAAAQVAPIYLDTVATIDKVAAVLREAAQQGAELVAFPECFLPGYPFFALVQTPLALSPFLVPLHAQAVVVPSAETERLGRAAREAGVYLCIGVVEREGGTLYNSQLLFGPDGGLRGRRRKLTPTSHERLVFGAGDGTDLTVWDTSLGRVGALVCYEHANALIRHSLSLQGEEIHVAAWPGGMPSILGIVDAASRHHAFESQSFVISVSAVLTAEAIAAVGGAQAGLRPGGGGSAIIAPRGDLLAGPAGPEETILYADLDPLLIVKLKTVVDTAGHYARADVVQLLINRSPQRPLVEGVSASSAGSSPGPSHQVAPETAGAASARSPVPSGPPPPPGQPDR
jgi:nitrilase